MIDIDAENILNHKLEKHIYPGFNTYLLTHFSTRKQIKFSDNYYLAEQVKSTNAKLGVRKNPDFIIATGLKRWFKPIQIDFHAIEVKKDLKEVEKTAVWQAMQFHDYANFSYVACPVTSFSRKTKPFQRTKILCERYGIGFITFENSDFPDGYEVVVEARRNIPEAKEVQKLYKSRAFIAEHFEIIENWGAVK